MLLSNEESSGAFSGYFPQIEHCFTPGLWSVCQFHQKRKWRPVLAAIFALNSGTLLSMSSCGSCVFGIQAFDSFIRVECSNSEIHNILNRYLFPPLPRSSQQTSPDIDIRIELARDEIRVFLNHDHVATSVTPEDAALATVKVLDDAVVHRLRNFHAVHAGVVLLDDRALLLPGATHAGKSSLVAELLRRGAVHFSDEYALIDRQGRVHSYSRPLLLRNGKPFQSLVLPEELNSRFAAHPATVGWIVAAEYVPRGKWDVRPVSQGEAVMLLLSNTPHEMEQEPRMLDSFQAVVKHAACYQGSRGDVAEAATHLLDLIRQK